MPRLPKPTRPSRRPPLHARPVTAAWLIALATPCMPASAASVNASYFTFADNGSFIDGDADYWTTRSRAVVDSGFVHQPTGIGLVSGHLTDWTWQGKASANLATGTLRTYAFSDTTDSGAPEMPPDHGHGWRTQTTANWSDAVVFVAPAGAPAGPPVATTFSLDVRGSFAGFYSEMTSTSFLMVNGVKSQVDFAWYGRFGPAGAIDATATTLGTVTHLSVDPRQLHAVLEVTVVAAPGVAISVIGSSFSKAAAGPYASATSDFDHTATLSIHAPDGYTFTSQSGVLLSVPEPATWLSMFAGLVVLATALKRRHGDGPTHITIPQVALGVMKTDSRRRGRSGASMAHAVLAIGTLATALSSCVAEAVTLLPVGFGASSFPQVVDHFNRLYLPFRTTGGAFTYGEHLVSSPGAGTPYNYQFESQYGAYGGDTPTLQLTTSASGLSIPGLGSSASVTGFYDLGVDILQELPAGATKVPLQMPVRISLLATQLPPGPPDFNTAAQITAHLTWTDSNHHSPQYLINIVGACMNTHLPVCSGSSVNIDTVVLFDVDPNAATRLGYGLNGSVRPIAAGVFDGYVNGTIDPLPRLSLTADPVAYGLPAGSKFSDYYALRFSPNLYTVAQLPVPEPSTWLLCAVGLMATTTYVRRRVER